jgi:hypothetical protein
MRVWQNESMRVKVAREASKDQRLIEMLCQQNSESTPTTTSHLVKTWTAKTKRAGIHEINRQIGGVGATF